MLYRIPVFVRIVALPRLISGVDNWQCSMRNVVRHGRLRVLDQIGFYLLADKGADTSPKRLRSMMKVTTRGQVVVKAGSMYEAVALVMDHPGVIGTGRERPDKKAAWLDADEPIIELPDCDMDSAYRGGCFRLNTNGWAICPYVAEVPINMEHGYCHCFLQGIYEPNTGCEVEDHFDKRVFDGEPIIIPAFKYMPLPK